MRSQFWILLFVFMILPAMEYQEPSCDVPPMSDQKVKDIIDKERSTRTDLPAPFPEYKWVVRRQGCYYVYIEYGLPEAFHREHIFKLNQYGVIADADTDKLKCPNKVLTESELAEIVKTQRAKRKDLPVEFSNYKTRVSRLRCLYLYFEYAVPEKRGSYQVFTIDPYGELMEFTRSKPY